MKRSVAFAIGLFSTFSTVCGFSQVSYDFFVATPSPVYTLALQTDGKILVDSITAPQRLNSDGSLDLSWRLAPVEAVYATTLQSDGRIIMGGEFKSLAGAARQNIARINANGTIDSTFQAAFDGTVFCLGVQLDDKVLVGGVSPGLGLKRLNPDGSIDLTFKPAISNAGLFSIAVQQDGKILVGGSLLLNDGRGRAIARLNSDGSLDESFDGPLPSFVTSMVVQPDGEILATGYLENLPAQTTNRLWRLNANGSLDSSFTPLPNNLVSSIALQVDGKILVGGSFTSLNKQPWKGLGRLNPNGSLDKTFLPLGLENVHSIAIQPDGKVLVGQYSSTATGDLQSYVSRVQNTEPAVQVLGLQGSDITWLRSGSSPELWYVLFQSSTNELDWTDLGPGTRIPGGWGLSGLTSIPGKFLRARGYVHGAQYNGSSWIIESKTDLGNPTIPVITEQPQNLTNYNGDTVEFHVRAGLAPLSYQWSKQGTNLAGATLSALRISGLQSVDAGSYSVIVSNAYGSASSSNARLTVLLRPAISEIGIKYTEQFGFNVSARECQRVIIQASTDLQLWTDIQTNNIGLHWIVGFGFADPASTNLPTRFYRIRQE